MRSLRFTALLVALTVLVLLALSAPLSAQSGPTVNPDVNPYGAYHGSDFESVTLPNDLLEVHIPLISYPQRGKLQLGFHLDYNNRQFSSTQICTTTCEVIWFQTGNGLAILPDLDYVTGNPYNGPQGKVAGFQAVTPDGASHTMGSTSSSTWFAMDGSGFQYNSSTDVLIDSNGVRYAGSVTGGYYVPTKVEDPNGNLITAVINPSTESEVFTDSLGRSIPGPFGPNTQTTNFTGCTGTQPTSSAYTWALPGVNGGTANFLICVTNVIITYPTSGCTMEGNPKCQAFHVTEGLIQSIVLPNGTAWTFEYDGYGDLTSITLPTGGTVIYAWKLNTSDSPTLVYPQITTRTINANDGTGPHSWTYSLYATESPVTVTDPAGNQTVHTFGQKSCGTISPIVCLYETEVQYYQGSATLLKTVNTTYQYTAGSANLLAVPSTITTTWANGKVAETKKTYGTTGMTLDGKYSGNAILGQLTKQQDYDYGSGSAGALLRTTNTTYMAVSGSTYLTNGLLRLPATIAVDNGAGTQLALTTYAYDASALNASGVSSTYLDPSPPDGTYRGNLTSITRWLNTPSSNVVSTKKYWDTGEVYTSTTPNLNTTTYNYTCTAAYLQTVTDPLGHMTTYNPDCNTGLVLSVTDENNQTTSHQYDVSRRMTQTNYPDGGQVAECYTDTVGGSCAGSPPYEVVTTTLLSSGNMVETEVFDGFGRLSQKQVNSDPGGTDYTAITYDALGRKYSQSNPYRTTSDPTYGVTTFTYDPLGRPTVTTNPDNTTITKSYTGAATQIADEGNGTASVTHVHQKDGLGRLVSVCEVTSATQLGTSGTPAACSQDIAATGFLTTYTYDALGNLLSSSQSGLNARSFTYDSLSRLISDTNPESGTITYAYDGDSNTTSRVAPLPNQTSSSVTVTTTYGYDTLDRLTSKSYSDGTTPSVAMTYDVPPSGAPGTLAYPVGRLLEASVGNAITWKSYDKVGRTAEEWQCTPVNCGTGTFALPYTYGPAGELLTFTNGAGVTLTNQYDTAAQLTNVASSLQDSNHESPLLTNPTYNAPGLVTALQLGNGVNESYNYDDRLRLTTMTAGTVYSLTMGYAPDSDVSSAIDSANGSWTYTYDAFNRLSASNQNSGATKFTYAYDRCGNRWQQNVTAGSGPSSSLSFSGGNNRVDGDSYDAAGNLLSDGLHSYTYDAENRIIKVDTGTTAAYVYDAFGQRIQKASSLGTVSYLYDFAEKEVTEINSSATWTRTEVYAGGKHLATYSGGASGTTTYIHADWLGTERVRTGVSGATSETCTSLPFGDGQTCTGTDVSPMHFTGKHRDTESNLDDFGARYYSSGMARWVTPDWSARQEAVPYVDLGNPQSLNLYAYVGNNPTTDTDASGHDRWSQAQQNGGCWFQSTQACDSETFSPTSTDLNSPSTDSPDQATAQNQNSINMSVSVSQEPQIMENLNLGDKTMTGVGAQLNISLTDKSGNPISGSVTESNKEGGMTNPGSVPLTNGAFKDYVGKFGDASKMPGTVADLKSYVTTNPITVTSTQTLNISTGKASYQATWTRTLSNVDAHGKLNTTLNSHGMNFTIKWTNPVIKAISP